MNTLQKVSTWFARLKTWQKVIVIWLTLSIIIGPFLSDSNSSQSSWGKATSQTGVIESTSSDTPIQTGATEKKEEQTPPIELTPEEVAKQKIEVDKKLLEEYVSKNEFSLISECKKAIKEQLKAPSTADFPSFDYNFWTVKDGIVIKSYVDAQNSYGAQIRTHFQCNFDFKDGEASLVQALLEE